MEHGWTATKEALPPTGERVLIISKWGHVTDGSLVAYDPKEAPLFYLGGLEPGGHVNGGCQCWRTDGTRSKSKNHGRGKRS